MTAHRTVKNPYKGIYRQTNVNSTRYFARYTFAKHCYYLGTYASAEEAYCVREAFEYSLIYGEFVSEHVNTEQTYTKELEQFVRIVVGVAHIYANVIGQNAVAKDFYNYIITNNPLK